MQSSDVQKHSLFADQVDGADPTTFGKLNHSRTNLPRPDVQIVVIVDIQPIELRILTELLAAF